MVGVGRFVAVEVRVGVAVGCSASVLVVTVSGVTVSWTAVSGVKARQASSVKKETKMAMKMRRMG